MNGLSKKAVHFELKIQRHERKVTIKLNLALILFLSACSPKVKFIGNQFAPTQSIDLYFDAKDTQKEYKHGILQNEGRELANNLDKIKEALLEEVKRRGVDVVLFDNGYEELVKTTDAISFGDWARYASEFLDCFTLS